MIYHTSAERHVQAGLAAFAKKYGITVQNYYATGSPLSVRFASEIASNDHSGRRALCKRSIDLRQDTPQTFKS